MVWSLWRFLVILVSVLSLDTIARAHMFWASFSTSNRRRVSNICVTIACPYVHLVGPSLGKTCAVDLSCRKLPTCECERFSWSQWNPLPTWSSSTPSKLRPWNSKSSLYGCLSNLVYRTHDRTTNFSWANQQQQPVCFIWSWPKTSPFSCLSSESTLVMEDWVL